MYLKVFIEPSLIFFFFFFPVLTTPNPINLSSEVLLYNLLLFFLFSSPAMQKKQMGSTCVFENKSSYLFSLSLGLEA